MSRDLQEAPLGERFLDAAERLLDGTAARLTLSFLIVVSVLPESSLSRLLPGLDERTASLLFLAVFVPELSLRAAVILRRRHRSEATRAELALLALDALAVASFLPVHLFDPGLAGLRLARMVRMLLLVGYWGGTVRELWGILSDRDWRNQLALVLAAGALIAFAVAVLLAALGTSFDFDEDGRLDPDDRHFTTILWWSFLQIEDPGNVVREPRQLAVLAASLALTLAGVLLFSFLIGIGTSAVEELMRRARERPVGLSHHTAVLDLGPFGHLMLDELVELYRKNRRRFAAAVLARDGAIPASLHDPKGRSIRYRHGDATTGDDLARVDLRRAARVVVLGAAERDDARTISAILAARTLHPSAPLWAVLEHERNFAAARQAGGRSTRVVGAASFFGHHLAQAVLHPGVERLFAQLLTSRGCEIYSHVFDAEESARLVALGPTLDVASVYRDAFRRGVTVLGFLVAAPDAEVPDAAELGVVLNPLADHDAHPAFEGRGLSTSWIHGLVGLCLRWEDLVTEATRLLDRLPSGDDVPVGAGPHNPLFAATEPPTLRLLICGGSQRVPRIVRGVIATRPTSDVTVVVRDRGRLEQLAVDIADALDGRLPGIPGERSLPVSRAATEDGLDLALEERGGRVRLRHLDWTDPWRLVDHRDLDLPTVDTLLFVPHADETPDGDGQVALDCLRLSRFIARERLELRAGFRVLAVVRDPANGDLLAERLRTVDGGATGSMFTILSSERIRHHYVVQNLFVEALNRVYLDLFDPDTQCVGRLAPVGGREQIDIEPLIDQLAAQRRLLLGMELVDERGSEVVLDPRRLYRLGSVPSERVAAIYVLEEGPK